MADQTSTESLAATAPPLATAILPPGHTVTDRFDYPDGEIVRYVARPDGSEYVQLFTPVTNAQARADLLAQFDRSGIPQAVDLTRQRDEVVSEFAGNPQAMASAILQLRASLALARSPAIQSGPTSTKHSSGGWNRNIPPARKYPVIFAGRNKHVCRLITDGMTDDEVEANANLIAAAPDMLSALKLSARAFEGPLTGVEEWALHAVLAAISKASGGAT